MKTLTISMFAVLLIISTAVIAQDQNSYHETFDVKSGGSLELDLKTGGDIIITGWEKNQVDAKVKIKGRDADDVNVSFEEENGNVEIKLSYDYSDNHSSDAIVEVNVPQKYNLEILTYGGDIKIKNVSGNIEGQTYGGDLYLLKLEGNISLTTMGGDIDIQDSNVDGKLKTMGGDFNMKNLVGNIDVETMGGDIKQKNVKSSKKIEGPITNTTMGGDITIDEAKYGAKVKTMGGDIIVHSVSKYCEAETMGGDINVKSLDGWIEATTMGGDISVRMVENLTNDKNDIELTSMSGDITLYVPSDFSMNVKIDIVYRERYEQKVKIISDFDLTEERKTDYDDDRSKMHLLGSGSFNGGKNKVKIKTHGGKVYLKKL